MRRGAMTIGVAPPADTGAPLPMECPLPCAVLACTKARDGAGAGRDTHQATYDAYYLPHRSPGRPTNGEFNPPGALGCHGAPVPAGALNHIWHPHVQIGPYFDPESLHLGVPWHSDPKHRPTQLNI